MVKTMKFVIFLTIWALTTKTSYQIYDPGDQNQKPVTYTAGIKTSSYRRPSQIEFHHNYSKVFPDNYNNDNSEEIDASRRPFPVYNAHTYGARPQSERLTQVYVINGTRIRPNVNPARQIVIYKKRKRTPKIEIYRGCPVNATGQFVYEFSCNQFLNCWKGRGYVQNCAPGTLFNPKTLECDYPEKVTCVSGPRLSVLEEERSAKIIKQVGCPKEFSGLIPNYTDCSKFINCVNGIENLMDCPPGTLFDIDKNICDFAHKANCFNGENQNLTKRADGSGNCNKQFCSDERNLHKRHQERVSCPQGVSGLYKHPTDCSKFLNCAEGRTYIQDCAPGTRFNPFLKICDFPYNVRCENVEEDITNPPATHYPPTIGYQPARIEYGRDYVSGTYKNSNNQYESINQQKGEIGCVGSANCGSTDRYRNQYNQPERGTYGTSSRYDGNQYNQNHHHQGSVGTHQTGYEQETGTYGQSNWNQNRYYKGTAAGTHRETNIYDSSSNYYKGSASGHQNLYGQQSGGYDTSGIYREQNNWSQGHRNKGYVDPHTGTVPDISTNYYNKGFTSGHRNLYEQQSGGYDTSVIYRDQNNWGQVHHNKGYFDPRKGSVRVYYPENRKGNQYETSSTGSVSQQSGVYVTPSIYDTEPNNWGQDRYNQGHQQTGTWNPHHTDNYRGNQSGIHVTTYSHGERPGNNWRQDAYNQGEVINIGNPQYTRGYKGNHQGWVKGSNAQNNWDPNRATGTSYQNNRWNQGTSTVYPSPNQHNRQNQDNQYTRPSGETGTLWEQGPIGINNQQNYNGLEQQEWQPSKGENVYRFIKGSNNNWQQNSYHNKGNYDSNWRDGNRLDQQLTPNYDQVVNINEHTRTTTPPYIKPYESSYGTTRNPRVHHSNDYDDTFGSSSNHNVATTPKIVEKNWPPPFPSTDVNADYVFEYDDDEVSLEAENSIKDNHKKNGCGKSDFRCTQDVCIPKTLVCNGARDCQNGQDELHCLDYVSKFSVNKGHKLAILEKERWDNVTIATCALMCIETQKFLCKSFNYRMIDKTCFLSNTNEALTGALISYNPFDYYELISEKIDCSDMYVCSNKKCIQRKQICDGHDDCGDRMDEKGCKPEDFGYKVKLVGSQHKNEGAIQVTAFGKVGYICDDGFHLNDAKVACKELGYPLGAVEVKGNSFYAKNLTGSLFYMMDDVGCVGNESRLMDCDFSGWGVHNCKGQEIVGVVCKTALERCPADYWQCETGQECLPLTFVCDNVLDCTDESDEATHLCDAPTEIRLANGTSRQEGRVEIKHNGIWGTICDDDFNEDAAKVVCRHLGYKGSATVKKDGYFGPGTGPIWLDQVFCSGNETSLESCSHWNWGEHNCEHSEDVGVICSNIYHHERSAAVSVPELPQVYPDKCGYRKDNIFNRNDEVHFRVVKGSIAEKGEYPWQAAIRVKGKSKAAHWCGAVIISEKFVLTAAHCLIGYPKGAYIVVVGDYNIDEYEGTEQESYIEDYYIHENFRQGHKMNNDIALVKLKGRGFRLNDDVQVICLPEANATYEDNLNCTISGFGSIESGKSAFSHNLRAGWIPLQKREICTMPHVYGNALTDGMFCAGSLDEGIDACDGDSGGPLACLNNGVFTLYGITSWGQHCGYANKPGVYVKIAHYRKWIDDNFHKHSTTQK